MIILQLMLAAFILATGINFGPVRSSQQGEIGNEPLYEMSRETPVAGGGDVQGLQGLGESYSIRVHGVASDGSPEPPTPTPGTPEPTLVVEPVGTPAPLCDGWECVLIDVGWPEWEIPTALAVIWCESTDNPYAYNPSGASGLFQVMMPLHAGKLYPGEDIFDPWVNARVALELYWESGWQPWLASQHCWS